MKIAAKILRDLTLSALMIFIVSSCSVSKNQEIVKILDKAKIVWSASPENKEEAGRITGDVRTGLRLSGSDRKASLERGGQGRYSDFNGGYVDLGQGKNNSLDFEGYSFTLQIRFYVPDGNWDKTIISKGGDEDKVSWKLYGRPFGIDPANKGWEMSMQNYYSYGDEEGKGYALEFELGVQPQPFLTESRKEAGARRHNTFVVGVPVSMIGYGKWHDVTVRFSGPRLEMFVDGVLLDEEWPIGKLRSNDSPCLVGASATSGGTGSGFRGKVEYAAVWDAALSNDEITLLCGGKQKVAEAETEILGKEPSCFQYWRPRGHNIWTGDVVPAYNNGRFHLFYLYDRRHHGSKWGAGAHQFAHYSTTDLVHWEKHPMALEITRQWETFGTGCPIFAGNRLELHYGLHTTRFFDDSLTTDPIIAKGLEEKGRYEPIPTENIDQEWLEKDVPIGHAVAVSEDGINFTKLKMVFTPAQNMCVFNSSEKKQYCLLYDNRLSISEDLREWKPTNETFLPTGNQTSANNTSECPNYFEWNGWHYILMGGSGFWMSREELGNYWEGSGSSKSKVTHPRWDIYDGTFVPMVASFKDNRRLLAGWTFSPAPHGSWGGYLVFRELIQYPDGTLGMKWPEEMIPKTGAPLNWKLSKTGEGITATGGSLTIKANGIRKAGIKDLPLSYRLTMDVVPGINIKSLGVQFLSDNSIEGCELQLIPDKNHAQFGQFREDSISAFIPHTDDRNSPNHPMMGTDFSLANVEGLNKPFRLDIIVKYDKTSNILLVDACIDNRRTMITHRYKLKCNYINIFADNGEADFKNITISPLVQ